MALVADRCRQRRTRDTVGAGARESHAATTGGMMRQSQCLYYYTLLGFESSLRPLPLRLSSCGYGRRCPLSAASWFCPSCSLAFPTPRPRWPSVLAGDRHAGALRPGLRRRPPARQRFEGTETIRVQTERADARAIVLNAIDLDVHATATIAARRPRAPGRSTRIESADGDAHRARSRSPQGPADIRIQLRPASSTTSCAASI